MDGVQKEKYKQMFAITKLLVLIVIAIGIPAVVLFYYPDFFRQFKDLDTVTAWIDEYRAISGLVYMGLQILQIIISIIPGQMIPFAAGYLFLFWVAYLFSMIGIAVGTVLTFFLAKILGKDGMYIIFGEEKMTYFIHRLNSKKAYITLFVLFLIPGFPKDLITYAAGVSNVKLGPFLILSLLGRTPALMITILMGTMMRTQSYQGMVILSVVMAVIFLLCLLYRKKLAVLSDVIYEKLWRVR